MRIGRKLGIILIAVGVFIPAALYPSASLTSAAIVTRVDFTVRGVLYEATFKDLEVVLYRGNYVKDNRDSGHWKGTVAIPYPHIIALGITIECVGIALLAFSRRKKKPCIKGVIS